MQSQTLAGRTATLPCRTARRTFARNAEKLRARLLHTQARQTRQLNTRATAQEQVTAAENDVCFKTGRRRALTTRSFRIDINFHAGSISASSQLQLHDLWGSEHHALPRVSHSAPSAILQSKQLAQDLVQRMPAAGVAALCATLAAASPAGAIDFPSPPPQQQAAPQQQAGAKQSMEFQGNKSQDAPALSGSQQSRGGESSGLPEGNQWRYSEFIGAVQRGKVERVRFAKDGTQLQLTAVDGPALTLLAGRRLIHPAAPQPCCACSNADYIQLASATSL